VIEGQVDDAVGRLRSGAQAVQIIHVAAHNLRRGTVKRLGTSIQAAESGDVMASVDEFQNEIGTDRAGGTCPETPACGTSFHYWPLAEYPPPASKSPRFNIRSCD